MRAAVLQNSHRLQADLASRLTVEGRYGVHLFFIISGFVLALPFAAHWLFDSRPVKLRDYYMRRLTRLEPPYVLTLTFFFVLFVVLHRADAGGALQLHRLSGTPNLLPHYLAGLFYAHNLVYGRFDLINGVAWSLEIEVQFYLLVPLLALMFRIKPASRRRAVLIGASLATIALQATVIDPGWPWPPQISNGVLEGINSLVQAAKRRARGYRSTRNLIAMIYLIAGKLDMASTHTM